MKRENKKIYFLLPALVILAVIVINVVSGSFGGADSKKQRCFMENALCEICNALITAHNLSPDHVDVWHSTGFETLKDVHSSCKALIDTLDKDGVLLRAALLCKNNGVLPYYITIILAYAMLSEDVSDTSVADIQEYVRCYGLKRAISKYCDLEKEPELVQLIADQYRKINGNCEDSGEKIELMKSAYHYGFFNEKKYKGCAQCTLLTMFQVFGRRSDTLFQSASALAAGMALSGDGVCGGYSGGTMYMGSIVGRRLSCLEDGDREAKETSYRMAQALRDRFLDTYGSVICADVHQEIFGRAFCLRTSQIKNEFEAAGAHTTKCTTVIGTVCMWLAEIIFDSGYTVKKAEDC